MNYRILVRRNVELMRCPGCNEIATLKKTRSPNIFYKFLKFFKFQNYICRSCGLKNNFFMYRRGRNAFTVIMLYTGMMAFGALLVYFILKTFFK